MAPTNTHPSRVTVQPLPSPAEKVQAAGPEQPAVAALQLPPAAPATPPARLVARGGSERRRVTAEALPPDAGAAAGRGQVNKSASALCLQAPRASPRHCTRLLCRRAHRRRRRWQGSQAGGGSRSLCGRCGLSPGRPLSAWRGSRYQVGEGEQCAQRVWRRPFPASPCACAALRRSTSG